MTLERFGSGELLQPPTLPQTTFLLEPGGQDYVGNNSYDANGEWTEAKWTDKEPT